MTPSSSPHPSVPEGSGGSPAPGNDGEIDLSVLWRILFKRRFLILTISFASAVISVVYALLAPPKYLATATLEARPILLQSKDEGSFGRVLNDGSINILSEEDIATTAAKLLHHDFLAIVAGDPILQEAMKPGFKEALRPAPGQKAPPIESLIIDYLKKNIEIEPIRKTRLIDITASYHDPGVTALIANCFVRGIISAGLSSRAEIAGKKIGDLESEFREADSRLIDAERRHALYLRSMEVREALTKTRNEVKSLSGRYKAKHPRMIEAMEVVRSQENALMAELDKVRKHPIDSDYWKEALARLIPDGNLEEDSSDVEFLQAENLLAGRAQFLSAEVEALRTLHSGLSLRLNEIKIANNAPDLDLRLAQAAVPPKPREKVAPKKPLLVAAGTFLGASFGLSLALLLGILRPRIEDAADWKAATTLPLLGSISEFPSPEMTPFEIVDNAKSYNPLMEQVRNFRNRLISPVTPSAQRTILVTSALPEDGKTTTASLLALSLRRVTPSQVVLVDLDLQRPSIHKDLRLPNDLGVSDILLNRCNLRDALIEVDGLAVLTAGSLPLEALDQLGTPALAAMLQELKDLHKIVVIDSSPVLPTSDTRLIAPLCDETVIVVNVRTTPTFSFLQAVEEIASANGRISGGILNQIPAGIHEKSPQYQYLAKAYDQISRRLVPQLLR